MNIVINYWNKDENGRPTRIVWSAVKYDGDTEIVSETANGTLLIGDDITFDEPDEYTTSFLVGLVQQHVGESKIEARMASVL